MPGPRSVKIASTLPSLTVLSQTHRQLSSVYASVNFRRSMMFKGRHFDRSMILLCVRWYLAYGLSPRNREEMMAERGISVDHTTIHIWIIRYSPEPVERFNARKRVVTGKWHIDETLYLMGVAGHSHSMRPE